MRLEDYTPENICKAMGLESFAADSSLLDGQEALRVVFLPFSHPEVTLTFSQSGSLLTASVATLQRTLWEETGFARPAAMTATRLLAEPSFEALRGNFTEAQSTLEPNRREIAMGEVSVAACYYSDQPPVSFHVQATASNAVRSFCAASISAAWDVATDSRISNPLAEMARYFGITYPHTPATFTRLLILGKRDERKEGLGARIFGW